MKGRQRIATNSQICGNLNGSIYDGKRMSRDCVCGTYEIAGRLIFIVYLLVVYKFSVYLLVVCIY